MLIGELSDRTGVSARALRHYDRFGLLPSRRRSNRYRDFTDDAIEQVRRIRLLLDVGLDLDAARRLLPCFADDGSLTACPAARDRLRAEIRTLDERLATVRATRRMLIGLLEELEGADRPAHRSNQREAPHAATPPTSPTPGSYVSVEPPPSESGGTHVIRPASTPAPPAPRPALPRPAAR